MPVEAFSPWDPTWPAFIDRGYAAIERQFAAKAPPPVLVGTGRPLAAKPAGTSIASLYVGVHGDYGESGLMMGARVNVPEQKEDWQRRFGNLHDHLGWWCHDPLARADFRAAMLQKYGTLAALNAAWKRDLKTPEEIVYPAAPRVEARREWLDFVQWYDASVGWQSSSTSARRAGCSRIPFSCFPRGSLMRTRAEATITASFQKLPLNSRPTYVPPTAPSGHSPKTPQPCSAASAAPADSTRRRSGRSRPR